MADIYTRGVAERANGETVFVLSTAGIKRDGLSLDPARWRLDRYNRNPVLLVNHDYSELPIGRAEVFMDGSQLKFKPVYDMSDPRAIEVKRKVDEGFINASSAGWGFIAADGTPFSGRDVGEAFYDLLDVSIVTVPADQDALVEGRLAAARALLDQAERVLEGEATDDGAEAEATTEGNPADTSADADALPIVADASGEDVERIVVTVSEPVAEREAEPDTWERVAAEMVAVFTVTGDDADDKARRRRYNALMPKYRRLGKFPPEFLTADELRALGPEEWRDLWLEGEVNERAGAVLNARNRERLVAARDAIDEVLASAEKAPAGDDGRGLRTFEVVDLTALQADVAALAARLDAYLGLTTTDDVAATEAPVTGEDAPTEVSDELAIDDDAAVLAALAAKLNGDD